MKFSISSAIALLAAVTTATPTPTKPDQTIEKRASVSDACNLGYATTNGGTTGGSGGTVTTVSSLSAFSSAVKGDSKAIVVVSGSISGSGDEIKVGSNKSIIGKSGSSLTNVNLQIKSVSNVIVRNMKLSKVVGNDAITVQKATNVWIDHCDLSSDMSHDKDYYDGLVDITHACDWVTVSNCYFHDHWKASLVGHSDSNSAEDTGHLHVTYANNYWNNINSRGPSLRFGTGHIYNSYYNNMLDSGINTRMGAQVLVQSTVFVNSAKAIESADSDTTGYAVVSDVDLGGSTNTAPQGTLTSVPYSYSLLGSGNVKSSVTSSAGQNLGF